MRLFLLVASTGIPACRQTGNLYVASPRIELGSGASETLILSIVLRGHYVKPKVQGLNKEMKPAYLDFVYWVLDFSI